MAEATLEKDETVVTLYNKGKRRYLLALDPKTSKPIFHEAGTSRAYTAKEAAEHEGYPDLIDVTKMPGQEDARKTKADKERLEKENEALRAQLAALVPATAADPVPDESAAKPKAKKA